MERFEKPRSQLDPDDEMDFATIGRRIERWDILRDTSLSFDERRQKINNEIQGEISALRELPASEEAETEMSELAMDIGDLWELSNNEDEIGRLADERQAYYRDILEKLKQAL